MTVIVFLAAGAIIARRRLQRINARLQAQLDFEEEFGSDTDGTVINSSVTHNPAAERAM